MECDRLISVSVARAFESRGCPICRLVSKAEANQIKGMLYEGVNNPRVRRGFVKAGGLCPYHAWLLASIVISDPLLHPISPTLMYASVLEKAIEDIEKKRYRSGGGCPLCDIAKKFEEMYVEVMAACFDKGELIREYSASQSVMCLTHYRAVASAMESDEMREKLKSIQVRKMRAILERMREYIRKQDYRASEAPTEEQEKAWLAAIEALKGYRTSVMIRRC